jgi:peroxiredoxin
MRSDIRPGGVFPDYSLPDHTNVVRTLSELQGDDPMILTLARGNYCPKEHQQHLELAANYPKIAVAYTQVVTIATDDHHTLQEFRGAVGAQWTFLSDPARTIQKDLDIQEYTDPEHNPMIPHTLVLKPGLVRCVERDPPRLGPEQTGIARGLGCRRLLELSRLEQTGRRVDAHIV